MKCDYCSEPAEQVRGSVIYPHRRDLARKWFWRCIPCGAYVGCHQGSGRPLGRLANKQLRSAKQSAHAAFDPIWKSGRMKRGKAYSWLAKQLGIPKKHCHIGMFDVDMCSRVVEVCGKATEAHL